MSSDERTEPAALRAPLERAGQEEHTRACRRREADRFASNHLVRAVPSTDPVNGGRCRRRHRAVVPPRSAREPPDDRRSMNSFAVTAACAVNIYALRGERDSAINKTDSPCFRKFLT